jgi:ribokinase
MKWQKPRVAVVGSFVTDLVFRVERRPGPGETMLADDFGMFLGGKGFNQAIAARRLGADVTMVGRVGADVFGEMFLAKLAAVGIDARCVRRDSEAGTAIASPVVDAQGQNSIIAAPRANMRVTLGDVEAAAESIAAADVLMLQFEIPLVASRRAAEIARENETLVLLDPAPVGHGADGKHEARNPKSETNPNDPIQNRKSKTQSLRPLDHFYIDYLVPNEVEAHMLTGRTTPEECAAVLLPETRRGVVISLGERGALAVSRAQMAEFPAHKVKVVDSTGAGDAFRAGLAVKIAEGAALEDAVRFANACGALACTVFGTEPSMPTRDAVERLLEEVT